MTDVERSHPTPERVVAFRLGKLSGAEAAELQTHLTDCLACRGLAEALQPETLKSLLEGNSPTLPPGGEKPEKAATLVTANPAAAPKFPVPSELADHPRYRLLAMLGTGGMGSVYKAEHRVMERQVALKVINQNLTDDATAVERFHREVKAAAGLSHPNIVTAYDAEQAKDLHFLVMEFVEGTSLDHYVEQKGPLPIAEACDYARQVALGLQHAHERGMVHRDIKPQNLMRTPAGQIKILDFGLARFIRGSKQVAVLTKGGTVMGTPDYIAPEQAYDARTADIRADIYSLGCTLYFMLTGQVPFPGGSLVQKVMAHVNRAPAPVTAWRSDVPDNVVRIVDRMRAKAPADRFQTPADVAQALAPFAPPSGASSSPTIDYVLPADPPALPPVSAPPQALPPVGDDPATAAARASPTLLESEVQVPLARPKAAEGATSIRKTLTPPAIGRPDLARKLGVVALILGVVALPVSCISCFGMMSLPLSGVGLLLGGVSLAAAWYRGERRSDVPIAGLVINLVALGFAVTWMFGTGNSDSGRPHPTVQGTPKSSPKKRSPAKEEKKSGLTGDDKVRASPKEGVVPLWIEGQSPFLPQPVLETNGEWPH